MIRAACTIERGPFRVEVDFASSARVLGVFGASGSGKSTLLEAIAGLQPVGRGRIEVDGTVLVDRAKGIDVPAHRRAVAMVFQDHRLFPHRSVEGNLRYGMAAAPARDGLRFDEVVDLLELAPHLAKRPSQLSGGERQRVALGRALLRHPRLLLLDEPLASLDRRLRGQILPFLRRVVDAAQVPIAYVSHELGEILRLTDELLLLDAGRQVGLGRYGDLLHEPRAAGVVRERGMANLLAVRVERHDPTAGSSTVEAPGGVRLVMPLLDRPVGGELVVGVPPKDVALAAGALERVSIQNQLPATVERVSMHERMALVEVSLGGAGGPRLFAEVSHRAVAELAVAPGTRVVCLVKAQAVEPL